MTRRSKAEHDALEAEVAYLEEQRAWLRDRFGRVLPTEVSADFPRTHPPPSPGSWEAFSS